MSEHTLQESLIETCRRHGDQPAFSDSSGVEVTFGQALAEFVGLGRQLLIAEGFYIIRQGVYLLDDLAHALELPVIAGAEHGFKYFANHGVSTF